MQVYFRIVEKRVYQTLKVASNCTGIFYRKERWEEANSTGLLVFK